MSLLLTFGKKSVIQRAISVLRKYGTDAHAYIPGVGVLNGLTAGNYTDSARTAPGSKDQFVGGVTDALDGIHATQGAAGNKPVLRQGPVNLLTYSNDLSNAAWALLGTATKSGSTMLTPAPLDRVEHTCVNPAGQLTLAAVLSGSGTCKIFGYNATNGSLGALTITLTDTPTLYVSTLTSTVANTLIAVGRSTGTATAIGIHSAGVFIGTLTANQILAAGGIPITTSIKASAGTGPQYWEFGGDGTPTDYLGLGSVPFQMSDDFVVVVATTPRSTSSRLFSVFGTSSSIDLMISSGGVIQLRLEDDAGAAVFVANGPTNLLQTAAVVSARKTGNIFETKTNGSNLRQYTNTFGTCTLTGANIAASNAFGYFGGDIYCVFVIKGTVSDADLLLVEKLAANLAGITI